MMRRRIRPAAAFGFSASTVEHDAAYQGGTGPSDEGVADWLAIAMVRACTIPAMETPATSLSQPTPACTLRSELRPGDLGRIVWLHGTVYAHECGFDPTFEAYVAGPLAEFVRTRTDRDRLSIS